jgi:enoyl-CoA hydratase/carnithine racemase
LSKTPAFLIHERNGDIVTLTMNSPAERNALSNQAQWDELSDAAEALKRDTSVKVVILTGAGSAFSAGGNVKDMRDKKGIASGSPYQIRNGYRNGIQKIPSSFVDLDIPTIAAVNGAAIGAGCDLACMCDIRIASEHAKFAESFTKLGIIPGDGGAWLLQRIIGYAKAAELSFTGDMINATHALQMGLVNSVVPADQLMTEAMALATRIAQNPGPALRMTKKLLRTAQHARLAEVLELSAALQAIAHHTEEHDRAVEGFLATMKK